MSGKINDCADEMIGNDTSPNLSDKSTFQAGHFNDDTLEITGKQVAPDAPHGSAGNFNDDTLAVEGHTSG